MWRSALLLALTCGSCAAPLRRPGNDDAVPDVHVEWKGARLPQTVRPLAYRLDARVVPGEDLSGRVEIDVEIAEPTRVVYLHARGLKQVEAAGMAVVNATDEIIGLVAEEPLRGRVTLKLAFVAAMGREPKGAFVRSLGGRAYAYTQFEPTWARRAFPCFDEPGWKVPWSVTLRVRPEHRAFANAPVASERRERGVKVVTFAPTPPLPSYLIAFAVGPFEIVEGGRTQRGVPVRVVKPAGMRAHWGLGDARAAVRLIESAERYLGLPFPFAKLDLVAVPAWNGGMENAGLITYSIDDRSAYLFAHEVVHQWFGDLVTMAWWNDVWLHESFATWLGLKLLDGRGAVGYLLNAPTEAVLLEDPGTVLQPTFERDDVRFRAAYEKGGAILRMVGHWVGEHRFREAVQRFLARHAWKSVTTEDFLRELPEAATVLKAFLSRAETPLLEMDLECAADRPRLHIKQRNAVPFPVPVCVHTEVYQPCHLVDQPSATIELAGACPAWLGPSKDGTGLYSVVPGERLRPLLKDRNQMGLLETTRISYDLLRAFREAALPVGEALPLLRAVVRHDDPYVASAWARELDALIPDDLRAEYQRLFRDIWSGVQVPEGARASLLGHLLYRNELSAGDRQVFLDWLGGKPGKGIDELIPFAVTDPTLAQAALERIDRGELKRPAVVVLLEAMLAAPETRPLARRFILGRSDLASPTMVPKLLRTICDESALAQVKAWARPVLGNAGLPEIERCIALRKYHEPSLRAYLAGQRGGH